MIQLALFAVGCGSQAPLDGAPVSGSVGTGVVSGDAATPDAGQRQCRWLGYGIGAIGRGQCSFEHLAAHALNICAEMRGVPVASRTIKDACSIDGDEAQLECCADGVPPSPPNAARSGPFDNFGLLTQRLLPPDSGRTRDEGLASAVARCAASGTMLGDWAVLYDDDGITPLAVLFGCR